MLVVGTFANDRGVLQALLDIERAGIGKERLLVVAMDASPDEALEWTNPMAGHSAAETGIAVATATAVVCISRGFATAWGPIVWGLIGAAGGFATGFALNRLFVRHRRSRIRRSKASELTVLVECEEAERLRVVSALWNNEALAVGLCPVKS